MEIDEEGVLCGMCGEVCKRGVRLGCCSSIGCRACATKFITREKKCWNSGCEALITTKDLINDDALRARVDAFLAKKNQVEAEAKKAEEERKRAEESKVEEERRKKEAAEREAAEAARKAEEEAKRKKEAARKAEEESKRKKEEERLRLENTKKPSQNSIPNVTNNHGSEGSLTIDMMRQRNEEFDLKLTHIERKCNELRYGAQLELMFTFGDKKASCRLCGQELQGDFVVLKHVQMKHKDIYQDMKTVLGAPNLNGLNLCLHKAIKAEFTFAQKQIFPCPVEY